MARIERFDDVRAFYAAVAPYLERTEAAHTFQLGVRERLERDPHVFGSADPLLYAAYSGDDVTGIALQTPPYNLVLSLFSDERATDALAESLAADGHELPGLNGPVGVGSRFVERWAELRDCTVEVILEERIYEATELIPPRPVSGHARLYTEADREVVLAWMAAFFAEAMPDPPESDVETFLARRALDPDAVLLLWDDDGPVALAGYASPSPNGMRVGPVYTPPELRGRGYASAVTAAATQRIFDDGRSLCFLYTDLANPTSNSIYQRIGYRPVADVTLWRFGAT
jgi:hypothetical protein